MTTPPPTPPNGKQPSSETPAFVDTRRFKVMRTVIGALNPVIRRLLASRLGGRPGRALLLLRFQGRSSGRWYETPVGYVREEDRLIVITSRSYTWWRNIRDGAEIQVRAAGQWYDAHARVVPPDDPAFDELIAIQVAARGPGMLRGFGMPVDDDGRLPDGSRESATTQALVIEVTLGTPVVGPHQ